jgi:hypothetical protein
MTTPPHDPASGQYDPNPGHYDPNPGQYGAAPGQFGQVPEQYGQAPGQFAPGPGQYGQGLGQYGQYGPGPGPQPGFPGGPNPMPGTSLAAVARKRGMRQIVIGAVIFVIGLVITVATYGSASSSPAGGTYVVAYGPMILGVVYVIRGISVIARAQKLN